MRKLIPVEEVTKSQALTIDNVIKEWSIANFGSNNSEKNVSPIQTLQRR